MWGALVGRFAGPALAAILGLLVALGLRKDAKKDGKREVEHDHLKEQHKRGEDAREAIADEKKQTAGADNRTVLDRMRSRDDHWR